MSLIIHDSKAELKWVEVDPDGPSRYARPIAEREWEQHRPFITFLHEGRLTRARILETLKICNEFFPSESQLNKKLGVWKLKVYKKPNQSQFAQIDVVHGLIKRFNVQQLRPAGVVVSGISDTHPLPETPGESIQSDGSGLTLIRPPTPRESSGSVHSADDSAGHQQSAGPFPPFSTTSVMRTQLDDSWSDDFSEVKDRCHIFRWSPNLYSDLNAIILLTQGPSDSSSHDILTDVGQLLYTCHLFSEAHFIFNESYVHLTNRKDAPYMALLHCGMDCIRAAVPWKECIHENVSAMVDGVETILTSTTAKLMYTADDGIAAGHSYYVILSQMLEDIERSSGFSPVNIREWRKPEWSSSSKFNSTDWLLCHSDLIWRCSVSQHPSDEQRVKSLLESWIADLSLESCHIWLILRECLKMLQDYRNIMLRSQMKSHPDWNGTGSLYTNASILGCFFVRTYLRRVLSNGSDSVSPLTEDERLAKILSFKLTIETYFVMATWIKKSLPTTRQSYPADPATALISCVLSILKISPAQRASDFLAIQKDMWYIAAQERRAATPVLSSRFFIVKTAELMAKASIHMNKTTRYTYADPIIGKRTRPLSSSTRSWSSTRSMRAMAKRLRGQPQAADGMFSIDELSDKTSTMTVDPNLRFSAVTGMASNPSWRQSISDVASLGRRLSLSASKRSSINFTA